MLWLPFVAAALVLVPVGLVTPPPPAAGPDIPPSDAGSGHDADDACTPGAAQSIQISPGQTLYGYFTFGVDRFDHYEMPVASDGDVQITMDPAPDLPDSLPVPNYDLQLLNAACGVVASSELDGSQAETIAGPLAAGAYKVRVHVPGGVPVSAGPRAAEGPALDSSGLYCDPMCTLVGYVVARAP